MILGILAVAIVMAGASWWYRYTATHRAVEFWGPEMAKLIRDAPVVELWRLQPRLENVNQFSNGATPLRRAKSVDVSTARGLTHLRNALLEDRSFQWPAQPGRLDDRCKWALVFYDKGREVNRSLLFTADGTSVAAPPADRIVSTEPIAAGLLEMFTEMMAGPAAN